MCAYISLDMQCNTTQVKKSETLAFSTKQKDLEGFMLSERNDSKRQILYNFTYMWNMKNSNSQAKQKCTY